MNNDEKIQKKIVQLQNELSNLRNHQDSSIMICCFPGQVFLRSMEREKRIEYIKEEIQELKLSLNHYGQQNIIPDNS